jgi:hypothetical protein
VGSKFCHSPETIWGTTGSEMSIFLYTALIGSVSGTGGIAMKEIVGPTFVLIHGKMSCLHTPPHLPIKDGAMPSDNSFVFPYSAVRPLLTTVEMIV